MATTRRGEAMAWREAATLEQLNDAEVIGVQVDDLRLAIYRLDGAYYATDNICTHQFALMSEGYLEDGCIECPLHQALFDVRSGAVLEGPAKDALRTYAVRVEGRSILVEVPD